MGIDEEKKKKTYFKTKEEKSWTLKNENEPATHEVGELRTTLAVERSSSAPPTNEFFFSKYIKDSRRR
jgi:hypothetical protein